MPNIFTQSLGDAPREVSNWRLWFAVFTFGLLGASRGLDEGLISGTINQISFRSEYGLNSLPQDQAASTTGNITSMVQIGSVGGALVAFILCDKLGRIWATRQLCLVWAVGIVIYITSEGRLGQLYAGRFIAGLGIGQSVVVGPSYLTEISPRAIRGLCVCVFSANVYFGVMLGYFANYGTSLHISSDTSSQWIIPTTLHLMFAGIIFFLSFAMTESPRYLMKIGREDVAAKALSNLRNLPVDHFFVQSELSDIKGQLEREREATLGVGFLGPLKELFLLASNRYRLMLGVMAQILGQWSGASSITIYAPEFFEILGKTGNSEKLFVTAILGVVKFVAALMCALFLVDTLGRKRSLSIGILLQFVSMLYVAIFLAALPGISAGTESSDNAKRAGTGAIVFIFLSGVGWALGWNSIQYLVHAEIFPLRVRSLGTSIVMTLHFANQYGTSKAVPTMLLSMGAAGTFFFFAAVTFMGLIWGWWLLPETAGISLENEKMFELPWYLIGRHGARVAREVESTVVTAEKERSFSGHNKDHYENKIETA